ncbi:MAG: OB-fold domain-containing protein [Pseudomonadales bacterium]|nr:OB-fold domain-containing protein [Gammaproteobacteria bacterium]MBP6050280.1 OB-fold domain-containing protein [Pseudomonadales bacterium]
MSNDALPYAKPLPVLEGLSGEFYAWCRQGELRFQRCTDCGTFRHVPRELCAQCNSFAWEWARSSGRGTVYTWTVVQRALHPAFVNDTPLAPVVVEMEEGVRLLGNMVDCAPQELVIGLPVEVEFEAVTPEVSLPRFRRRPG